MPTIIKIVINIKLIVTVLLLQHANGFRNPDLKHETLQLNTNKDTPDLSHDSLAAKWMNTGNTVRKMYIYMVKSFMPHAYGLSSKMSFNCTYSLFEYFSGISHMKTWAFTMLDATAKIPSGMLSGKQMEFGDYDACLQVESPSRRFKGQYCYVESKLSLPKRKILTPADSPVEGINGIFEPETVFENIGQRSGFLYSHQFRFTTCLPNTCSKEDIKYLFKNVLTHLNFENEVYIPHCEVKENEKFTAMEIFIIILLTFLTCLVVMGTVLDILFRNKPNYDIETEEKSGTTKALLCFSAYTNFMRLIKVDHNPDTLHIFHGFRVMSMAWIIWSHTRLITSYYAFDGGLYGLEMGKTFLLQTVPCGFLAVETFFFMSSVLVAYICVRMRGRINVPIFFLKRYMRLTPSMMLVAAFFGIIGRLGSGPLWKEIVSDVLSRNCLERGWINLFYINNFLYSSKTCLGWTWYLSTDTQMFLVCLYICVILKKKPSRGILATGLMIITGILSSFFAHIYYRLPPTYLLSYLNFDDWYYYAFYGYTQIHFHLPVCAVGMIVGYILGTKRGHIPKIINTIGWILSALIFLTLMSLTYKWNQGLNALPGLLVSALYGSLHRFAWALCLAFITISCTWGQGGVVNSILSWEGFAPFARLTYMVYLVHYGLMYVSTGLVRQPMRYNNRTLIFLFFSNVSESFLLALVLCLLFESPLTALEKSFLRGGLKKQVQPVGDELSFLKLSLVEKTVILKDSV